MVELRKKAEQVAKRKFNPKKISQKESLYNDSLSSGISTKFSETPGPGKYDPVKVAKKSANLTSKGIFGTSEKRFVESDKTNTIVPGPGSYLEGINWKKSNSSQGRLISKPIRNPYEVDEEPRIEKEEDTIPAVGTYNSDVIYNMSYKIAKKNNKFSMVNAPFNSLTRRFNPSKQNSNVGPGYYYKDKKIESRAKSNIPFNVSDGRFRDPHSGSEVGPGIYNINSYFDWNKKTFNILFL